MIKWFDKITLNKIFKHLKTILAYKIDTVIDVGSHHGEYIKHINFLRKTIIYYILHVQFTSKMAQICAKIRAS